MVGGGGWASPAIILTGMSALFPQVIPLPLDLGRACVGMLTQKFSILPQEPEPHHPQPVLSHFPTGVLF